MVQCVHHGDEHQAHVGSVLGPAGVELPRLDPWAFLAYDARIDVAPGAWADALLARFTAFSGWATGELLEHCLGLGEGALAATAQGTYGTIQATLAHLIEGDGGFLNRVTGGPRVKLDATESPDVLRRHARRSREGWSAYVEARPNHERLADDGEEHLAPAWVLTTQALQHAGEHRAHIATVLGANGLALPPADVWAYGATVGADARRRARGGRSERLVPSRGRPLSWAVVQHGGDPGCPGCPGAGCAVAGGRPELGEPAGDITP